MRPNFFALALVVASFMPLPQGFTDSTDCPSDYTGKLLYPECAGYVYCHEGRETFRMDCPVGTKLFLEAEICVNERLVHECFAPTEAPIVDRTTLRENSIGELQRNLEGTDEDRRLAASTNPFLPDHAGTMCTNDRLADPWEVGNLMTAEACCSQHFLWAFAICMQNSNNYLSNGGSSSGDGDQGQGEPKMYYPDTAAGICKEDGPERPSWIGTLDADYSSCCSTWISWNLEECMQADPSSPPSEPASKFYPDSAVGYCKPDGPGRPSWITNVEDSYESCCTEWLEWNYEACMERKPVAPKPNIITTLTPKSTPPPTKNPTLAYDPFAPTTPNPTLHPSRAPATSAPTQLYYAESSTGICKKYDNSAPSWATTYSSFDECCNTGSWKIDECLQAKPADANDDVLGDAGGTRGSDVVIEITIFGTITFNGLILPATNSPEWSKLRIALTKAIILVMQDTGEVHPSLEVSLWSIGGQALNWRRELSAEESELVSIHRKTAALQLQFEMVVPTKCDTICQNNLGGYLGQTQYNAIEQHFQTYITTGYFTFVLNGEGEALGIFKDSKPSATTGQLSYRYAVKSLDLTWVPTSFPTMSPIIAPSGAPSTVPSAMPSTSLSPTGAMYYPDYKNNVCKMMDGGHSEFETNFFVGLEACCSFPWLNKDHCMVFSFTESPTQHPTRKPSRRPTSRPTNRPTTARPTGAPTRIPTQFPTNKPTKRSRRPTTHPTSTPTQKPTNGPTSFTPKPTPKSTTAPSKDPTPQPTPKPVPQPTPQNNGLPVYYADLDLGVCKSDGNHGSNPYTFSTAEACCANDYFDYDSCMSVAKPKPIYYPDFGAGYCLSDGLHGGAKFQFDSAEECCDNKIMEYDYCISMSEPTPEPPKPTPEPTQQPTQQPEDHPTLYYPDFDAKFCRSDGQHGDSQYVFTTAASCCDNAWMDKDECILLSEGSNDTGPTSAYPTYRPTTLFPTWSPSTLSPTLPPHTSDPSRAPTSKPTLKPTPAPTNKPTWAPTQSFTIPPHVNTAIDARFFTNEIEDGFENGFDGLFPWHTTESLPWTPSTEAVIEGTKSARSAAVTAGENSDLHVAIISDYGGGLFFALKPDVQMPWSGCYINVDGESKKGYTYKSEWMQLTLPITAGSHVIMFRVWSPNAMVPPNSSPASNTIFLDHVSFQPNLLEGFENGKLRWDAVQLSGAAHWDFDSSKSNEGNFSFRSPGLDIGQFSRMSFEVTIPRRGSVLSFWYYSSVSTGQFLFKVDGQQLLEKTIITSGWQQYTLNLPPGKPTLVWEYTREEESWSPNGASSDAVWIDDIKIIPRT